MVDKVVDGDTVDVRGVGRIRVIGIDTPERQALLAATHTIDEMREFINCSCAGSNGFCTARSGARIASRKNRSVMPVAIIVIRERRNE